MRPLGDPFDQKGRLCDSSHLKVNHLGTLLPLLVILVNLVVLLALANLVIHVNLVILVILVVLIVLIILVVAIVVLLLLYWLCQRTFAPASFLNYYVIYVQQPLTGVDT